MLLLPKSHQSKEGCIMKQQQITQLPSGSWRTQVRYTDKEGNKRKKSITAPTQWEVIKLTEDFRNGVYIEATKTTVRQAIQNYIDCRRELRSPSTIRGYECILQTRLQHIMNMDAQALKKADINMAIAKDASRGLSYKSIKEAVALLRSALSEIDITIPPVNKYTMPPKSPPKGELPDLQTVLDILIGSSVELPSLLALWCGGMRMSEVRGLQYRDITTDKDGNHYVYINRVKLSISGVDHVRDVNKTEQSTRTVPLPEYLYNMIVNKPHASDKDFIVDEKYTTIKQRYDRLMKKNGIHMTFHDLRAQFATTMNSLGVDKIILQKMGGWSNSQVLDKVYIRTPQQEINDSMKLYCEYLQSMMK